LTAAQAHGQPMLLDVREPGELATASVTVDGPTSGFELLAMPMGSVPSRLAELDAARPVACLCHHGARSQRVAQFLEAQGFTQVVNIAGGIDAWSQELDPRVARY
jgi:rhodanese-related sulfurtransferase